jgi:hypothetical protein
MRRKRARAPPESAETKMLDKIKGIRKNLGSTIS